METWRNNGSDMPGGPYEDNPLNAITAAKAERVLRVLRKTRFEIDEVLRGDARLTDKATDEL